MEYKLFQGEKISRLSFGMMRLPLIEGTKDIDEDQVERMVKMAIDGGVNYFDTAYPYHESKSELVAGRVLSKYPRDSYFLATKYPGHQIADSYDPKAIFEEQLKKCRVDYFDFYLLHNVNENSIGVYMDPKWGILDYFKEQKRLGKIRHLGFSCHGDIPCMKEFLDYCGEDMEFCQIQLNYLDWKLQKADQKYELLSQRNIPVWVMEPVRGGRLANLPDASAEKIKALGGNSSQASYALRWVLGKENVCTILSGMSSIDQMSDNLKTFNNYIPLSEKESKALDEIGDDMTSFVPCTGCGYCLSGCPKKLDIPGFFNLYNDMKVFVSVNIRIRYDSLDESKRADQCIGCGACKSICPQGIDVPSRLSDFVKEVSSLKSWAEICRERAAAAAANK